MNVTDQRTVGAIASETPAAVKVFEKHGIDFCCGGKLPLDQACREQGVAMAEVLEDLEKAVTGPAEDTTDWKSAPLGELVDHILDTHHVYLRSNLPRLEQMAAKVLGAHGEKHGETLAPVQEVFLGLKSELESHMWKEEMVLFPLIRGLEASQASGEKAPPAHCGSVNNPIRIMEHEHDSAGHALAEMRRLTANYTVPEDACNTYRALYYEMGELEKDLHRHIHLENNILFPRASRLEAVLV